MRKILVISFAFIVTLGLYPSVASYWFHQSDTDISAHHGTSRRSSRVLRDIPADAADYGQDHSSRRSSRGGGRRGGRLRGGVSTSSVPSSTLPPPRNELDLSLSEQSGNYSNDNNTEECAPCQMREQRKELRIAMIKQEVLRKLKLEQPPTFNSSKPNLTLLPAGILDNFENGSTPMPSLSDDPEGNFQNIIFGITPPMIDYIEEKGSEIDTDNVIYFQLGSDVLSSTLNKAHLSVFIKPKQYTTDAVTFIKVYKLVNDSNGNIVKPSTPDIRQRIFMNEAGTNKWYNFHFKNIADEWKRHPEKNLGLYIECNDWSQQNLVLIQADDDDDDSDDKSRVPLLQLDMSERTTSKRKRRQSHHMTCREGSTEARCCRYPLTVDFDEFGWDWILQPRQYPAFYCAGECPFTFYPGSAHSHVVLLQKDSNLAGGPCCTPVKMSRISMIYFNDDGTLTSKNLEDMVVDRCGCN